MRHAFTLPQEHGSVMLEPGLELAVRGGRFGTDDDAVGARVRALIAAGKLRAVDVSAPVVEPSSKAARKPRGAKPEGSA